MIDQLTSNVCLVSFIKKDGAARLMSCTRHPNFLPIRETNQSTRRVRTENLNVVSAFDINKLEFRSFLLENVVNVEILKKEEVAKRAKITS